MDGIVATADCVQFLLRIYDFSSLHLPIICNYIVLSSLFFLSFSISWP